MNKKVIYNKTKKEEISASFKCASSFLKKFKGLMLNKNKNEKLILKLNSENKYSSSIHTFFMMYPIILYFIDYQNKVYDIKELKPWKIYIPKKEAKYVIETYDKINLNLNDEIKF